MKPFKQIADGLIRALIWLEATLEWIAKTADYVAVKYKAIMKAMGK